MTHHDEDEQIIVTFNLRCFLLGHDWQKNGSNEYAWCFRCLKEKGGN